MAYERSRFPAELPSTAQFQNGQVNPVQAVSDAPVSTFSADVDTASYAYVRRFLRDGQMPPKAALRSEEMVNYFTYDYARPASAEQGFAIDTALMPTPWNPDTRLLRIGVQGYKPAVAGRIPVNVTLLVDVSGSMAGADRLPLAKAAMHLLAKSLQPEDHVAVVTYASGTAVPLQSAKLGDGAELSRAIEALRAGGGTAGSDGLKLAYAEAERGFRKGAANRVILFTDGDFNLGISDPAKLRQFVADKRKSGIYLSVLGFGLSNVNDVMMQSLAQSGNGTAAYIDGLDEARRVLVENMSATLIPLADDVKIQVEFNPAKVAEYRLIGYETRMLARSDFKNDAVDAGEIGDGHQVTALYEIAAPGSPGLLTDPLRYGKSPGNQAAATEPSSEIAHVRLRFKAPGQASSREVSRAVTEADAFTASAAPTDLRFAAAVAGWSQILRADPYVKAFSHADVLRLAENARGQDAGGWRAEFIRMVRGTEALARK